MAITSQAAAHMLTPTVNGAGCRARGALLVLRGRTGLKRHEHTEGINVTERKHNQENPNHGNTRETKTKELSCGKALMLHCDPWHAHRTKDPALENTKQG